MFLDSKCYYKKILISTPGFTLVEIVFSIKKFKQKLNTYPLAISNQLLYLQQLLKK